MSGCIIDDDANIDGPKLQRLIVGKLHSISLSIQLIH